MAPPPKGLPHHLGDKELDPKQVGQQRSIPKLGDMGDKKEHKADTLRKAKRIPNSNLFGEKNLSESKHLHLGGLTWNPMAWTFGRLASSTNHVGLFQGIIRLGNQCEGSTSFPFTTAAFSTLLKEIFKTTSLLETHISSGTWHVVYNSSS